MPADGSYSLGEFGPEMVEVACDKCGRSGRLRRERLIAEHGPDVKLPDLRGAIAQCPRYGSMSDLCGIYFVALKP